MIKIGLIDFTPEDKVLSILDKNDIVKAKYAIDKNDIWKHSLMSENYIEISFFLNVYVAFKRADYILWDGEKFAIRADYQPEQVNKRKYKYTLKFEAVDMFLKDIQYYYLSQDLKESEWRLFGNPEYFIKIAVDNANRYFGTTDFKIGTIQPTEAKDILFDVNTTIFDALTQIAEEYDAEWYVTDKIIHLVNKLEFGDEVDFETEVSVLEMKRDEGDNKEKYTRILALGSERNIPRNYRETAGGEGVDAIYSKRLRIPAAKGSVIDAYPNMTNDEAIEGTVIFDDVYPKRVGTIESIGTIQYQDKDEETGQVTKWDAYKIKDSGIEFKEEYLLPGIDLRLQFVSGDLNGMDFDLFFKAKGFTKTDNSQYFEIKRNDDYGKDLPNATLKPSIGDKYVLYGFDIALVGDQYVPEAEQELYDEAVEWLEKQQRDTSVYECPTAIQYFTKNNLDLDLGQRVKLLLDKSDRSSRIMGFEKKLNNVYDAIYTVGDNPVYSRFNKIEENIKELQIEGMAQSQSGNVYIIKNIDSTRPTDFNVFSSKKSLNTFLRKDQDDSTEHLLQLLQGAEFGEFINSLSHGKGAAIDGQGKAQVESLEVRSYLKVMELIYNRLSAVDGDVVFTDSGVIESIQEIEEDTYILTLRKRWEKDFTTFQGGDVLRGVVNNLLTTGEYHTSWMRVITVNNVQNSITVISYPDSEVPVGKNYLPTETMVLHRWGNTINKDRQQTFYTSSTEGRSVYLVDVTQPILKDYNYSSFWGKPIRLKAFEDQPINYNQPYFYSRGMLVQDLIRVDYQGQVIKEIIDAGPWQQGKEYKNGEEHPYQQHDVWLGGNRWRCLINNTTEKPRWNSPCWIPIGGNQLLRMKLANTHGTLFRPGQVYTSFIASVYYGDINITADIEPLDWQWLRETSNPNADLAWIEAHKEATNEIEITDKDIDPNYRNQTRFICKAYVRLRDEITELRKDIIV